MRHRFFSLALLGALIVGLAVGVAATRSPLTSSASPRLKAVAGQTASVTPIPRLSESSKNVIRVYGSDVYRTAVAVSQLVYPGSRAGAHPDAQPGVAILVPTGPGVEPFYAEALAAAALIHHPRNGPILFTDSDRLNADTAAELRRLNPTGGRDWPQVFVVGRVSQGVADEVGRMGFGAERVAGADPYETATLIDERVDRPGHVLVARGDDPSHGLPAVAWIAHMADSSLLFAERDHLPETTIRALQGRPEPFVVHILGPEEYVSAQVEQQLRAIPGAQAVTRIGPADPFTTAVEFAQFKQEAFGWGIAAAGHGFSFVALDRWQDAVAASLTAHLGGHGPLLLTAREALPAQTRRYLERVRPTFPNGDPTQARLNRGYLIAPPEVVSYDQQAEIDWLMESVPQDGGGMPGMDGGMHGPGH